MRKSIWEGRTEHLGGICQKLSGDGFPCCNSNSASPTPHLPKCLSAHSAGQGCRSIPPFFPPLREAFPRGRRSSSLEEGSGYPGLSGLSKTETSDSDHSSSQLERETSTVTENNPPYCNSPIIFLQMTSNLVTKQLVSRWVLPSNEFVPKFGISHYRICQGII